MRRRVLTIGGLITVVVLAIYLTLANDRQPPVTPLVAKLTETSADSVQIRKGTDDGVTVGDVFDVYQEGKPVGELKITKVEPDQSTAEITSLQGARQLKTGDQVIRDPTFQYLRQLRPETDIATPTQLGRRFATTDIKSGIKRILYYGEPWSAGKPLIDEETGSPVTITAGCAVTQDFTLLVNEYNRIMAEHSRQP